MNRSAKLGDMVWLDVTAPDETDYGLLAKDYAIKPHTIQRIKSERMPAKLIAGEQRTFLNWSLFANDAEGKPLRVYFLLGDRLFITIHQEANDSVEKVWREAPKDPEGISRGPGWLLYQVLDDIIDEYFLSLDGLSDDVDSLEDVMFGRPEPLDVKKLFDVKKEMLRLRRIAAPEREVVNAMLRHLPDYMNGGMEPYLTDLYDHLVRILDLIDTLRDVTGGAMQIYQATISNNLNDIMKQLTLIATIMMPLTLISGIFGMNVLFPGFGQAAAFYIITGVMTVIGIIMLIWFRSKRWI